MHFGSNRDLSRHHLTHTGEKPFQCPHCPHRSNRKGNLKYHIISIHIKKDKELKFE